MKADRAKDRDEADEPKVSTLKELLRDKPKRGRPRRMVARQNVYVALRPEQKRLMDVLGKRLPVGLGRADVPDLAVSVLTARLEALRSAVAGRTREIPEGVTDLMSLYLLWDVAPGDERRADDGRRTTDDRRADDRRRTTDDGSRGDDGRRTTDDRRASSDERASLEPPAAVGGRPPAVDSSAAAGGRPSAVDSAGEERWTSIRLSPQQALELGRAHGTLNAAFGASRSDVFDLALVLLAQFLRRHPLGEAVMELGEVREMIFRE